MKDGQLCSFKDLLTTIMERSERDWVFLPSNLNWSLESISTSLELDEVPPEMEGEPDAGVPQFAKDHNLIEVVPVVVLQDVASNALQQRPNATIEDIFCAFKFYYENDAFIDFDKMRA